MNEKRIQWWAGFILTALVFIGVVVFGNWVWRQDGPIRNKEVRMFGTLFLVLCLGVVVMLVLLRNALVMNTAFLIKLRDQMGKSAQAMDKVEKALRQNGTDLDKQHAATQKLSDATKNLTAALREVRGTD